MSEKLRKENAEKKKRGIVFLRIVEKEKKKKSVNLTKSTDVHIYKNYHIPSMFLESHKLIRCLNVN